MERAGLKSHGVLRNCRDLKAIDAQIAHLEWALMCLRAYPPLVVSDRHVWALHGKLIDLKNLKVELESADYKRI
jgi:hypothetical protein